MLEGAKYVLSKLNKIFVFDPIPSHMRAYTALSDTLLSDGSNIAGVLAGLDGERKTQVETTITQYLKELPERDIKRIWTEPVGKFGTDAMLYCEEGWENQPTHEIDARGMSDGTLALSRYCHCFINPRARQFACDRGGRQWLASFTCPYSGKHA